MSITSNGINIPEAIMNLEFQLLRTQKILDFVLEQNAHIEAPSRSVLKDISDQALLQLQVKYPEADVVLDNNIDPQPRRGLRRRL